EDIEAVLGRDAGTSALPLEGQVEVARQCIRAVETGKRLRVAQFHEPLLMQGALPFQTVAVGMGDGVPAPHQRIRERRRVRRETEAAAYPMRLGEESSVQRGPRRAARHAAGVGVSEHYARIH